MAYISIPDNCPGKFFDCLTHEDKERIHRIADLTFSDILVNRNSLDHSLLVFPPDEDDIKDQYSSQNILNFDDNIIMTGNTMGFIGVGDTSIRIHSRFDHNNKDYFLHYLLQRVLQINFFDLPHTFSLDDVFDFLMLLFPYYLKKAMRQGLMRQYVWESHNDVSFKGILDVKRHIIRNYPYNGRIAYNTRHYTADNPMLRLIKLTINSILKNKFGYAILNGDAETQECIREIEKATSLCDERMSDKIIAQNIRSKIHPYYSEYEPLRRICIMILKHEGIRFGAKEKSIHGILFDGSWLWEEYIGQVLNRLFDHHHKNKGKRFYLFSENGRRFQQIVPDYISKDGTKIGDAKYIPLEMGRSFGEEKATALYYKTITYMYRFNSQHGFLFFPHQGTEPYIAQYEIISQKPDLDNGSLTLLGLPIPAYNDEIDYKNFITIMHRNEDSFLNAIKTINTNVNDLF